MEPLGDNGKVEELLDEVGRAAGDKPGKQGTSRSGADVGVRVSARRGSQRCRGRFRGDMAERLCSTPGFAGELLPDPGLLEPLTRLEVCGVEHPGQEWLGYERTHVPEGDGGASPETLSFWSSRISPPVWEVAAPRERAHKFLLVTGSLCPGHIGLARRTASPDISCHSRRERLPGQQPTPTAFCDSTVGDPFLSSVPPPRDRRVAHFSPHWMPGLPGLVSIV